MKWVVDSVKDDAARSVLRDLVSNWDGLPYTTTIPTTETLPKRKLTLYIGGGNFRLYANFDGVIKYVDFS